MDQWLHCTSFCIMWAQYFIEKARTGRNKRFLVEIGDRVVQGQPLAKCGNSGNSSEPHIHYQLQNGTSFYYAEGIPVGFSDITAEKREIYSRMDTRKVNQKLTQKDHVTYIERGWTVGNL